MEIVWERQQNSRNQSWVGYFGRAAFIEYAEISAPNFALIDRSTVQDCSQSTHVGTVTYLSNTSDKVSSVQRPDGQTYNFEYVTITDLAGPGEYEGWMMPARTRSHLSCIREPGQSTCSVRNEYDACDGPGAMFNDNGWTGSRDRVIRQTLGDGRVITYAYSPTYLPCRGIGTVTMNEGGRITTIEQDGHGNVSLLRDPLNRETRYQWDGANSQAIWVHRNGRLTSVIFPESNSLNYEYDGRGNVTVVRQRARPASGLGDLVQTAEYPETCVNRITCNRPISMTDARGNTTDYTYDPAHGGVLTQTGPAVPTTQNDGTIVSVRPQTRYEYAQRYARIRSGGGYVQAPTPIWVLLRERYCRTTAALGSTCAGGSADEVITDYDYGPDSGPNNLFLRGKTVTAQTYTWPNQTPTVAVHRTCYGYDQRGRRISETQPNAHLTSCP